MADEIAQVVEIEMKGITLAIKGGVEAASLISRMLKAAFNWADTRATEVKGEKSMKQIWDLSKDGPPQIVEVPQEHIKEILAKARSQGLRFRGVMDMNPADNLLPVCVPPQDLAMFSAIVKTFLANDIAESEKLLIEKNSIIAKEKDKLISASPEDRLLISAKIENLEQSKQELNEILNSSKKAMEQGTAMSFTDYLMTGMGTEFGKDPDKAIAELEKGVEIGRSFSAKDCLQPIRDERLMPSSKLTFYVPEMGTTIERQFSQDKETGLVYSDYFVKGDKGEIFSFSDKNITKENWNEKVLPKLMESTNILEDTQIRTFDTKDKFEAFLKYHNNVTPKSEQTVLKNAHTKGFTSEQVMREAEHANANFLKGLATALRERGKVEISVPQTDLIQKNGVITYKSPEGEEFQFSNISNGKLRDGKMSFCLDKSTKVNVESTKGQFIINAVEAKKRMEAVAETAELSQTIRR